MEKRILLVDDEKDILEFLSYNLERENYTVRAVDSGKKAIKEAQKFQPHLIVLDVMMPGMNGMETCQKLRQYAKLKDTVIVFLTAKSDEHSEIKGFDAGADDYIAKPINPRVFVSRINALMRRVNIAKETDSITTQNFVIDRAKYHIVKGDEIIVLPRKEFEILALLAAAPKQVFSRAEIFENVWDDNIVVGDRTIDVHIRKLREKIGDDCIKTVKGVGYKFHE